MRVRMTRTRMFLDAGRERPLDIGSVYDLPQIVAESLIATGAAVALTDEDVERRDALRSPETRPELAYETKRARRV